MLEVAVVGVVWMRTEPSDSIGKEERGQISRIRERVRERVGEEGKAGNKGN